MRRFATHKPKTVHNIIAWGLFVSLLIWTNALPRFTNLTTHVSGYGDVLEIIWGIEWYAHSFANGTSPFLYPYIFAPVGFQVGSLAHTPLYFTLAQPFYAIGGAVFAYHMMGLLGYVIAFAGSLRFFKSKHAATSIAASLVYTFIYMRTVRAGVHHNIWLMTAILPWLGWQINQYLLQGNRRHAYLIGILWGIANNFSLYAIFWVPIMLLALAHKRIFTKRSLINLSIIGTTVLIVSSVTIVPYWIGSRAAQTNPTPFEVMMQTGNAIPCLVTDSPASPITFVKSISRALCPQLGLAQEPFQLGTITVVLFVVGIILAMRPSVATARRWIVPVLVALLLSLGPVLIRSDSTPAQLDNGLMDNLWNLGYQIKPDVFLTAEIPNLYDDRVPLPAILPVISVPLFEGARQMGRYAFVALLAMLPLAIDVVDRAPKKVRHLLIVAWVLTTISSRPDWVPLPQSLSPAHKWLLDRPQQGVYLDLNDRAAFPAGTPRNSGDVLWASWLTQRPAATMVGSFIPAHTDRLRVEIQTSLPDQELAYFYATYGIEHVLIHEDTPDSKRLTQLYRESEQLFEEIGCFESEANTLWSYPICIFEVKPLTYDVLFDFGWSEEPWGVWAIDDAPHARFLTVESQPVTLEFEAFPYCVAGREQTLELIVNGEPVFSTAFSAECETQRHSVSLVAEQIEAGWNTIDLRMGYALAPNEIEANNADPRTLAVGFNELLVIR